jgi:hypothetical protein
MGIAGAVLYSLALISARELARVLSRADRALRWAFHLIGGAAHYVQACPQYPTARVGINER